MCINVKVSMDELCTLRTTMQDLQKRVYIVAPVKLEPANPSLRLMWTQRAHTQLRVDIHNLKRIATTSTSPYEISNRDNRRFEMYGACMKKHDLRSIPEATPLRMSRFFLTDP